MEKELYSGVKNDPILDWISAKYASLATSSSNADIMSVGSPTSSGNGLFTSAVIHASVNKNAIEKQAEKERKEKEEAEKLAKTQASKGSRGTSLNRALKSAKQQDTAPKTKSPQKNADLDTSFDRHATVDKITKRVEFIYVPTYQQMRKMILKALKIQARRI